MRADLVERLTLAWRGMRDGAARDAVADAISLAGRIQRAPVGTIVKCEPMNAGADDFNGYDVICDVSQPTVEFGQRVRLVVVGEEG